MPHLAPTTIAASEPAGIPAFRNGTWSSDEWRQIVQSLVENGIISWKDVATVVLGQMNPPQVGTSIATDKNVQAHFPKRKTWQGVRAWFYAQRGVCSRCGSRIDLQADHITEKAGVETYMLSNYQLLCRRCNSIKSKYKKRGGLTFQTTESALMWLLFVYGSPTYKEYEKLCRRYGLTMANIRFQEAWAMAEWLKREGKYPLKSTRPRLE
jgi:hypothetical protein